MHTSAASRSVILDAARHRPGFLNKIDDVLAAGKLGMVIAPRPSVQANKSLTDFKGEKPMLWTILVILLVLWLIGFLGHFGGGLIHLLLVIALIVFIINLVSGRRAV